MENLSARMSTEVAGQDTDNQARRAEQLEILQQAEQENLRKYHQKAGERALKMANRADGTDDDYVAQLLEASGFNEFLGIDPEQQNTDKIDEEIEEHSAAIELAERAMREKIAENVEFAARKYYDSENLISANDMYRNLMCARAAKANATGKYNRPPKLKELIDARKKLEDYQAHLEQSSPEAYTVINGLKLRENIRRVQRGSMVETPYVKENLARLTERMEEGKPTFISGPLGSGKTELAIAAATQTAIHKEALRQAQETMADAYPDLKETDAKYAVQLHKIYRRNCRDIQRDLEQGKTGTDKYRPLIISGSRDMSSQDLYTDKGLKLVEINKQSLQEQKAELDAEINKWHERHEDELRNLPDNERARRESEAAHQILELYKMKNEAFGTEVETIRKELLMGIEDGRPVIIDEANAIPAAVLISLNDILNRRPGQSCYVPGVGQRTIADGFSITMTGNVDENASRYAGVNEMNAAFDSRSKEIKYDYLPQNTGGLLNDQPNPRENELFYTAVCYLADRQGNLQLPSPANKTLSKLFGLCQLARETQDLFEGRGMTTMNREASGDMAEARLEKSVLSTRNLLNILEGWGKGMEMDLDHALWEEFISGIRNSEDQNTILALAKNRYGFFENANGWNVESKPVGAGFTTYREIYHGSNEYDAPELEAVSMQEVVDILYGERPRRALEDYPMLDMAELDRLNIKDIPDDEDVIELEQQLEKYNTAIRALEVLGAQCGCPAEEA